MAVILQKSAKKYALRSDKRSQKNWCNSSGYSLSSGINLTFYTTAFFFFLLFVMSGQGSALKQ